MIFIHLQILFYKIARLLAQSPCYAINIILVKYGTGGLAAISAVKAADFFKNLFMKSMKCVIHFSRILFLQALKKCSVIGRFVFGDFPETIQIHRAKVVIPENPKDHSYRSAFTGFCAAVREIWITMERSVQKATIEKAMP